MRLLHPGLAAVLALLIWSCAGTAPPPLTPTQSPAPSHASARIEPGFEGSWQLDAARSTSVDPWRSLSLDVEVQGDALIVERHWRSNREGGAYTDSIRVVPGGPAARIPMGQWPDNRHLGAFLGGDSTKTVVARMDDDGRTLVTESRLVVNVQQGEQGLRIYTEYRISPDGDRLDVLELRSTRPSPLHYVFSRAQS